MKKHILSILTIATAATLVLSCEDNIRQELPTPDVISYRERD